PELPERLVDVGAELADLLARAHRDRDRDGAAPLPLAVLVLRDEVVQVARRVVVAAGEGRDVAEAHRSARAAGGELRRLHVAEAAVTDVRVDDDVPPAGIEDA